MRYTEKDTGRIYDIDIEKTLDEPYRSPWSKDISRVIQTQYFKRLQGKSQMLPGQKSEFFRNRMTHSQEVAQLAKSIASKLNYDLKQGDETYFIEPELCELAALTHNLGRPPFGHIGEIALNRKMKESGGFESNAQTLRVITKLAKKHYIPGTVFDTGVTKEGEDKRVGLNLTYRSLAAILSYDNVIPEKLDFDSDDNVLIIKGHYEDELNVVKQIKRNVAGNENIKNFQTIESQILQLAEDIAYATYDLEEAFKIGFIKPLDIISVPEYQLTLITEKINRNLNTEYSNTKVLETLNNIFADLFINPFETAKADLTQNEKNELFSSALRMSKASSDTLALNGYYRINFISKLIGHFVKNVAIKEINASAPALTRIYLPEHTQLEIEALKCCMYISQMESPQIKMVRYRGIEIVSQLFDHLCKNGKELLPVDVKVLFDHSRNEMARKRTVCDFISRMTDSQAMDLYRRIETANPEIAFDKSGPWL